MFFHYVLGFPLHSDVTAAGHVTSGPVCACLRNTSAVSENTKGWSVPEKLCPRHKAAVYLTRPALSKEEKTLVSILKRLALACVVHLRCAEPNVAQRRRLSTHPRIVERRETGSAGTRLPYTAGDVIGTFLWQDRGQGCPGRTLANGRQRL